VMCSKGDVAAVCPGESCRVIEVPQVEDCLQPVVNIIPLQVSFLQFSAYVLLIFINHNWCNLK
jgi:glucosamine 6-phosphate synthetase-like amidotransferase/phosphosugar isomerase protein